MPGRMLPDFEPGKVIYIRGVAPNSGRFDFNLYSAEARDDIVFHFNPRFDQDCVVRNTRIGGYWGKEEREGGMPFTPGEKFVITVVRQNSCFLVFVNDKYFCKYDFRVSIGRMVYLDVDYACEYY